MVQTKVWFQVLRKLNFFCSECSQAYTRQNSDFSGNSLKKLQNNIKFPKKVILPILRNVFSTFLQQFMSLLRSYYLIASNVVPLRPNVFPIYVMVSWLLEYKHGIQWNKTHVQKNNIKALFENNRQNIEILLKKQPTILLDINSMGLYSVI